MASHRHRTCTNPPPPLHPRPSPPACRIGHESDIEPERQAGGGVGGKLWGGAATAAKCDNGVVFLGRPLRTELNTECAHCGARGRTPRAGLEGRLQRGKKKHRHLCLKYAAHFEMMCNNKWLQVNTWCGLFGFRFMASRWRHHLIVC